MRHTAYVHREDGAFVVTVPDCDGCQTQADDAGGVASTAEDALTRWLEAMLEAGKFLRCRASRSGCPA